ncbi:MAG: purine-nucleoside phosphorylase [Christensenellales bacterium]
MKDLRSAADAVRRACGEADIAVILGSGLGGYEDRLIDPQEIAYARIPGFPASTVPGHAGKFVVGTFKSRRVLVMSGRFHHYEGHSLDAVTLPIRVMALLGVKTLIITNAAGGVNQTFSPGDLTLITDYINLSGKNPLRGRNLDTFGPRFPDMTDAFDPGLREIALARARSHGIPLQQGVYCWMNGPSYESPAEIRMVRTLGADAVGMSTVPEVIVARHCGLRVVGISAITNMAAGVLDQPINHEEVLAMGEKIKGDFSTLLDSLIDHLSEEPSEAL